MIFCVDISHAGSSFEQLLTELFTSSTSPEVFIKNSCALTKLESPLFISACLIEKLCSFRFACNSLELILVSNPEISTFPNSSNMPSDWLKRASSVRKVKKLVLIKTLSSSNRFPFSSLDILSALIDSIFISFLSCSSAVHKLNCIRVTTPNKIIESFLSKNIDDLRL